MRLNKDGYYTQEGEIIPRLSHVLDFVFGSFVWGANGEAADLGTRIHEACQIDLETGVDMDTLVTRDENLTGYINGFRAAIKSLNLTGKPKCEVPLLFAWPENSSGAFQYRVGMRLDVVYPKDKVVIEIKTGQASPVHQPWNCSRYDMQLNTHLAACMQKFNTGSKLWSGYLLYLKENGKYQLIKRSYSENITTYFLYAVQVYYNINQEIMNGKYNNK